MWRLTVAQREEAAAMADIQQARGPNVEPHISRLEVLKGCVLQCASTDAGKLAIAELRWLAPDHSTLVSRVRAELGIPTGAGAWQLREAVEELGIPVRVGDKVSWGTAWPSWDTVVAMWQFPCCCDPGVGAGDDAAIEELAPAAPDTVTVLSVCGVCGGSRMVSGDAGEASGVCRWCGRRCATLCSACRRGIHFRGKCLWNRGASLLYSPSANAPRPACPDCLWA